MGPGGGSANRPCDPFATAETISAADADDSFGASRSAPHPEGRFKVDSGGLAAVAGDDRYRRSKAVMSMPERKCIGGLE
jgi:hypothetical protein